MNTKIFDYLNVYASTPDPQYAIMLRGKWGCGKTHFIKGWLNKFGKSPLARMAVPI